MLRKGSAGADLGLSLDVRVLDRHVRSVVLSRNLDLVVSVVVVVDDWSVVSFAGNVGLKHGSDRLRAVDGRGSSNEGASNWLVVVVDRLFDRRAFNWLFGRSVSGHGGSLNNFLVNVSLLNFLGSNFLSALFGNGGSSNSETLNLFHILLRNVRDFNLLGDELTLGTAMEN